MMIKQEDMMMEYSIMDHKDGYSIECESIIIIARTKTYVQEFLQTVYDQFKNVTIKNYSECKIEIQLNNGKIIVG